MKFKEIFTLTRPDITVPFNPPSSVFCPQSETDWTTAPIKQYFDVTYLNTGKCESVPVPMLLSDDGLTLTYTTVYLSEEAIHELYNDPFIQDDAAIRSAHWEKYNIISNTDMSPITE